MLSPKAARFLCLYIYNIASNLDSSKLFFSFCMYIYFQQQLLSFVLLKFPTSGPFFLPKQKVLAALLNSSSQQLVFFQRVQPYLFMKKAASIFFSPSELPETATISTFFSLLCSAVSQFQLPVYIFSKQLVFYSSSIVCSCASNVCVNISTCR